MRAVALLAFYVRSGAGVMAYNSRLVVVSNRVPSPSQVSPEQGRNVPVGGLVSAVRPAMEKYGGLWLGWSGRSAGGPRQANPHVTTLGNVELATLDLSSNDVNLFYTGFANRTLWPLLHSFTEHVVVRRDTYRAYRRINRRYAETLYPMLRKGDQVLINDFHLFNVGEELRDLGWQGKLGFFLHVPFPSSDIFSILPWSPDILRGLVCYDLVGLHTESYRRNLAETLESEIGGAVRDWDYFGEDGSTRLGVYHVGIDMGVFGEPAPEDVAALAGELSLPSSPEHQMILGVDRLDYTKGIPTRLRAFRRMLEHRPATRGRVSLVQISSPSRTRVPEYQSEKVAVDQLVGEINGQFSEAGWTPIRYLYRSYPQRELACFYWLADVCMVTPLRDGMNLVAKEFVASQGERPGVLLLSRFCGAASSMGDALIVNPYDVEGTAEATFSALSMTLTERRARWQSLNDVVRSHTENSWSDAFQSDLAGA